jgi:hypothetical protein
MQISGLQTCPARLHLPLSTKPTRLQRKTPGPNNNAIKAECCNSEVGQLDVFSRRNRASRVIASFAGCHSWGNRLEI